LFLAGWTIKEHTFLLQTIQKVFLVVLLLLIQNTKDLVQAKDPIFKQLRIQKLESFVFAAVAPSKQVENNNFLTAISV